MLIPLIIHLLLKAHPFVSKSLIAFPIERLLGTRHKLISKVTLWLHCLQLSLPNFDIMLELGSLKTDFGRRQPILYVVDIYRYNILSGQFDTMQAFYLQISLLLPIFDLLKLIFYGFKLVVFIFLKF